MKLTVEMELPTRVRTFFDELLKILECYEEVLNSIILFGSLVKGGYSEFSDADVIIVMKDTCPENKIAELNEKIDIIEDKVRCRSKIKSPFSLSESFAYRIGSFVEARTGMFVSHFICKRCDFLDGNFAKIFNTTPVLTRVLAPSGLVLAGVLSHAKTIYGEDLIDKVKRPRYTLGDMLKSLAMNVLLSLGSAFLYIFHSSAAKFAIEATKWSLHSSYFYLSSTSANIEDVARFYIDKKVSKKHLERMLNIRITGNTDLSFVLATMPNVVWIHLATISMAWRNYGLEKKRNK